MAVTAELYIHPKIMGAFASMVLPQLDMPFKGCEFVNLCLESGGWEEKNKKNIAEISEISREIDSIDLYRNVVMELAQNTDSPGKLMVIHYIAEAVKKQFLPKLTGVSYTDYQQDILEFILSPDRSKKWIKCHRLHQQIEAIRITTIQFGWMKLLSLKNLKENE